MRYMLDKEFEDLLLEFDEMGFEPTTLCENPQEEVKSFRNRLQQSLLELQAIKEAKPSEALKLVDELLKRYEDITDYNIYITKEWLLEIKQALLKAEKLEKAWEIVVKKNVNVFLLKHSDTVIKYNAFVKIESVKGFEQLTQEEFDLLKEMM